MKTLCMIGMLVTAASIAAAQAPTVSVVPAPDMQWKEGPRSLPPGAQMMVLEGDPSQPGPFTLRFKFPDGFQIQPHFHTQTEHATVLAGVLHLGMGDTFQPGALRALPAGSFGYWVAGTRHFARAEGETILQLHGMGPWTVQYVNAGDDPRRRRE